MLSGPLPLWVLLLALSFLELLCSAASAQQGDPVRATTGNWLGVGLLARKLVVRLDSAAAPTRDGPQRYYGRGYDVFPRDGQWPFPMIWVSRAPDSLDVSVVSLGGTGWRLKRTGDSLLGISYEFYDIVPNETTLGGPARGAKHARDWGRAAA